jgi:hypothetical protein
MLTCCSTLRNQKESPLLRLPAELRDKIYGYVFSGGRIIPHFSPIRNTFAIFQGFIRNQTIFGPVHGDNPLALLYVCRQTYAETALLPFQEFVFAVGGLGVDSFNLMMDAFTKQQRESIRHVALSSWGLPKILSEMAGYWNGTKGTTYGTYLVL